MLPKVRGGLDVYVFSVNVFYGVCIVQIPLNPHFSLARSLACVLLTINALIGLKNVPELLFTWTVVEDDRALYLFRDVTGKRIHVLDCELIGGLRFKER
ncbi:hypothetical protein Tco_1387722 [Tanacetum coccineum]